MRRRERAGPAASLHAVAISPLGSYQTGLFEQSAAEIVAHDPASQRLFVVNAASGMIDVLDVRDPASPTLLFNISVGGTVHRVAVHKGLIAAAVENPAHFNANHTANAADARSDDKGPEPEALAVAKLFGRSYAFIGLERVGGVMIYDITNPYAPDFAQYFNYRDFAAAPGTPAARDLGPEGIHVIEPQDSPIPGVPLLVVANEVSGTTTLFRIDRGQRVAQAAR